MSKYAVRRARIRLQKQKRRIFIINALIIAFFLTCNAFLVIFVWPKVMERRNNAAKNRLPKRDVRTSKKY